MSKFWLVCAMCVAMAGGVMAQTAQAPTVVLNVGDQAPDFTLPGTDGKSHKLSDYKGKHVVLAWYPAAFTGGCTAECKSFAEAGPQIKAFDVAYFMASTDPADRNKEFATSMQADFPLLSDPDTKVAAAYGVLGPKGRATRWTFYIAPDGKIAFIDKEVGKRVATAGPDVVAKLTELKARKKS
jgi:peroxiredoxin Q/BCP